MTSGGSSRSRPAAPKTRQPRDHRLERHRAVAAAVGLPCCGCSDDARDPHIASGRYRRVPDPKALPERSTGGSGRTPPNPPQPAAPTAAANAYASRHNHVQRSFSQPSPINAKKGRESDCVGSRVPISRAEHPPPGVVGSCSSSPSVGQCSIRRSHPRLPDQRLFFRAPPSGGTGGWSSRSRPYPRSSCSTSERS